MIAVATKPINAPIQAKRSPTILEKVPMSPMRPLRPNAYSAMISGTLQSKRKRSQAIKNAPAPASPLF